MSDGPPQPLHNGDGNANIPAAIRKDILRTNTAVVLVLAAVLALSLIAVLAGLRAARNSQRAQEAENAANDRLWYAYLAQSRAIRATVEAGRRETALGVVSNATAIRISSELRSEAIACLALSDLVLEGEIMPTPRDLQGEEMDPQLQHFAYGDSAGNIFVCSARDGKKLFTLQAAELGAGTRMPVGDLTFSPDGKILAARFAGGAVVVWNLENQQRVFSSGVASTNTTMSGLSFLTLSGLTYTPDSRQIIFSDHETGGQISVFDIATGQRVSNAIKVGVKLFRLRPDLKRVAVATETKIDLLNYPSAEIVQTLSHNARVAMMAWSPDGQHLAVSCEDGDVYIWDMTSGAPRLLPGHSERCVRMGFNPDGSLLFTSSRDGTTRVWDVSLAHAIAGGTGIAHAFGPDGQKLGFWRPWTGFGIWQIKPSEYYAAHACARSEGPLFTLDLSPGGRWCVATQNKGFRVWDLQSGDKEYYVSEPEVFCVRIASDEKSLLVCRSTGLEQWPLTTNSAGELDLRRDNATRIQLPDGRGARAISLSLDGRTAAVELNDKRMITLDLSGSNAPVIFNERWRTINYKGPASPTGAGRFAISPDGKWLVTGFDFGVGVGGADGPKIWDTHTGEFVTRLKTESSLAIFSSDGKHLGLAGVDRYSVWSVGDWKLEKEFSRDESSITHGALAFIANGGFLADARSRQIVQLCDPASGEKFADLISPIPQSVNAIRIALNGSLLVSATANDMVEVWRLDALRGELAGMNLNWGMDFSDDASNHATALSGWTPLRTTLVMTLVGFGLAAAFALVSLRRHRAAIDRFVAAEAMAAERNRELDMARVELMHSQKMQALGTLATGIAHDFNNLLSIIRMSSKLIGREVNGSAEVKEHVEDIDQAVLQGKHLVGSMLGYARTDDGAQGPTDVSAVVEDAVSLLSREFLSGITLSLELDREAPCVTMGRGRLEQVLLNLIVNASEAMQGQGRLKIVVHKRSLLPARKWVLRPSLLKTFVELSVSDSGPGIPPEIQDRVFEPFFTTKRSGSTAGTGLGLSLVYSIAQQDKLGVSIESAPGKGATFSVLIPIGPDATVRQKHTRQDAAPA